MPNYPEEIRNPPAGRWMWSEESHSLEFVRCCPAEESVRRRRSQSNADFNELQRRAAWLAETGSVNCRGRQSTTKYVKRAQLSSYRSSLMRNQGDYVTINDVKQVAVSLLQDNYLLPIPFYFLDLLKSKELDEVLAALLVYLSCFFDQKSLENKDTSLVVVDIITEERRMMEAVAKKELAQNKLAVCYFSLMMDLEREQHLPNHKGQMMSDKTEWLLHACLYSFLCYFAWVTFDRKELGDIQQEVGRLLYSDTFNAAVRNQDDGGSDSGTTSGTGTASAKKTGTAGPPETRWNSASKHSRASPRRPAPGGGVHHRSPLMVSLLPSPEERSPHLFPGSRARSQSPLGAARRDITALTEQLAGVRCGIVGRPLTEFSRSTLTPVGGLQHHHDGDSGRDHHNNNNKSADNGALKAAARPSQDPTGPHSHTHTPTHTLNSPAADLTR